MIEGQEGQTWEEWQALARACEENGLEGLFRSDHYGSLLGPRRAALDAWATLAALAGETTRIRLGTLVSPATFRHPSVLAKMAATVDHVSGGRVADEYNAPFVSPEEAQRIKTQWDKTLSVMTGCVLGEDRPQLLERVERVLARMERDDDPESFVAESRGSWVIGTLDEARARVAEYEAAGVERMMLQNLDHG